MLVMMMIMMMKFTRGATDEVAINIVPTRLPFPPLHFLHFLHDHDDYDDDDDDADEYDEDGGCDEDEVYGSMHIFDSNAILSM